MRRLSRPRRTGTHPSRGCRHGPGYLLATEAKVTFDPTRTSEIILKQAIEDAGYTAVEPQSSPTEPPDEYPAVRRRALISLAFGLAAMAAMPFTEHESMASRYTQLVAAVFVMAGPGREYYVRAAKGLAHRRFDMSTLIALVLTGRIYKYSR